MTKAGRGEDEADRQLIRQDGRGLSLSERLSHALHRYSWRTPLHALRLRGRVPLRLLAAPKDPVAGSKTAGEAILAGRISFGGKSISLAKLDFRALPDGAFADHVHSFTWLRDLAAAATRTAGSEIAEKAVSLWLDQCGAEVDQRAWRADLWGRRILFWMAYAPYILSTPDLVFRSAVLNALARGSRHLDRGAAKAPPGLPRVTAWAGLVASALIIQGGPARLRRAEAGLERALDEACHDDGGLASRSPEEQLALVELLGQLRAVYAAILTGMPERLEDALAACPAALLTATMGDGALGAWQGGGTADPPRVAAAIEGTGAQHRPLRLSKGWGYQRLEARRTLVVVDAAPPPPARAAHGGCASTLAFELSDGPHRLIVNCGGGRRAPDGLEAALRTTAAHSTLTLANRNSTALHDDGTLGKGVTEVAIARAAEEGVQSLEASHDGYVRRFGLGHRRRLALSPDGLTLEGEDRLEPSGRRRGGDLSFAARFHLGPLVEATSTADGKGALLRIRGGAVWQFRSPDGALGIEESLWIDPLGRPQQTQQLVLTGSAGGQGAAVHWTLRRAG